MKSIMYHYIRNKNKIFPYSNILQKKDFEKQIKKFSKIGLISSYKELFKDNNKFLPTFDDGIKDHVYAAKILKKYNSIGIFFIPTFPLKKNKILDVHKTHLIIGKVGGSKALKELKNYLKIHKIKNYQDQKEKKNFKIAYSKQLDSKSKKEFKKIMNYYGDLKIKHKILDYLLHKFKIKVKTKDFYLSKKEIKYLSSLGMIIGCHSESHNLLSRLSYKNQFKEIKRSKTFLEKIIKKKINIFCYPYGGKISYDKNTLKILRDLKFKQAYSVDNRDISMKDIQKKPFELPRYDCNLF